MTQEHSGESQDELTNQLQPVSNEIELAHCRNCGIPLNGLYCHRCGQSSRDMIKYIGDIFREILDDVVGYDSRLKHTIIPLLFKPGAITLDYIKGRRSYYVLPLRLYLICSVLLIILLKFNANPTFEFANEAQSQEVMSNINQEIEDAFQDKNNIGRVTDDENANSRLTNSLVVEDSNPAVNPDKSEFAESNIIDEKDLHDEERNFGISLQNGEIKFTGEEFENGMLKDFAQEINKKWRGWKEDPKPLVKQVIELLPYMMFILLPIFALFLKLFYALSKRYYIEHLIFLLHNHSFLYVALMLEMGLDILATSFTGSSSWSGRFLSGSADIVSTLLMWWMAIYIVWSMKRIYRQSWLKTLTKAFLLSIVYVSLISIGFVTTILIGAYLA